MIATGIAWIQDVQARHLTGQHAAPQRGVRHVGDAQLAARRDKLQFGLSPPQRVFGLERCNRCSRRGAAERLSPCFGKAEMPDPSSAYQPRHPAYRLLDRHVGVYPVQAVEIDHLDLKAPQAGLTSLPCIFGTAVHDLPSVLEQGPAGRIPAVAELGRYES